MLQGTLYLVAEEELQTVRVKDGGNGGKKKRTFYQINTKKQKSCSHVTSLQAQGHMIPFLPSSWFYQLRGPNFSTLLLLLLIHFSHR